MSEKAWKMEILFGRCCALNIMHIKLGSNPGQKHQAKQKIYAALENPEFQAFPFDWRTGDGLTPQAWLRQQVETEREST
jgi:hypothetical protein